MEYRLLGSTGLEVSAISLGGWATFGERLDDDETTAVLRAAYELGTNFFDGAETYANGRSEMAMGRALKRLGWPRETFLVSSKVYWGVHNRLPNTWGLSRKHLVDACHAALKRLQVEYLDLYLCHRYDDRVPLVEIVRAMSDLIRQGRVLHWGTSEWPAGKLREAYAVAKTEHLVPPQVEQLQYNFFVRGKVEHEMPALRNDLGIGLSTWSPLACGLFTGRYDQGCDATGRLSREKYEWLRREALGPDEEATLARVRSINALARELGTQPARLALAWVLRNRDVDTAITGASSPAQIRDNFQALALVSQLDEDSMRRIAEVITPITETKGCGGTLV